MFPPGTLELPLPSPDLPPLTLTTPLSLARAAVLGLWGLAEMLCEALSEDVQSLAWAPQPDPNPQPDRFKFNCLGSRAQKLAAAGNCAQLLSFPHIFLA